MLASCVLSAFPRRSFDSALILLTYCAALFVARGLLANDRNRRWIVRVVAGLSLAITLVIAALWGTTVIRWMSIAGPGVLPPLNLELTGHIWGHRHDLALLAAMLYPAWWMGRPSRWQRWLGVAVGVISLFVVIIDGSRTVWIAVAIATAIFAVGPALRAWRASRRVRLAVITAAVGIGLFLLLSGLGLGILSRATNVSSLGFRGEMWESLVDSWLARPIAGSGPGSFPWSLQGVGYYDTNSLAPRHPDSAPIQLLAESGVLGVTALGVLLWTLVPAVVSGRSRGATWALLTFVIASLGGNPSDFSYVVAVAIVWTAFAAPRPPIEPDHDEHQRGFGRLGWLSFAAGAAIAVAYLLTVVAAGAYESARGATARLDYGRAAASLDLATRLDPGMAIYARGRGVLDYVEGDLDSAVVHFRHATELNPHDPVAWRSLATAYRAVGNRAAAASALAEAIRLMRADTASLLLRAEWQAQEGNDEQAVETLAEVVHAWPQITAADGWSALLERSGIAASTVIDAAVERWEHDLPIPETIADQGVWLASLSGRDDLLPRALRASGYDPSLWPLTVASLRCQRMTAPLESATPGAKQTPAYWGLRLRDSALTGVPDPDGLWMLEAGNGSHLVEPRFRETPLTGVTNDLWGYRRLPVMPGELEPTLPTPDAGVASWYLEPRSAGARAGVGECAT